MKTYYFKICLALLNKILAVRLSLLKILEKNKDFYVLNYSCKVRNKKDLI